MKVLHHYTETINEVLCKVGVIISDEKENRCYSYVTDFETERVFKFLLKKPKCQFVALNYLKKRIIS